MRCETTPRGEPPRLRRCRRRARRAVRLCCAGRSRRGGARSRPCGPSGSRSTGVWAQAPHPTGSRAEARLPHGVVLTPRLSGTPHCRADALLYVHLLRAGLRPWRRATAAAAERRASLVPRVTELALKRLERMLQRCLTAWASLVLLRKREARRAAGQPAPPSVAHEPRTGRH